MGSLKENTINKIIAVEGGYVDDPDDSGGETKFGITEQVARQNGYHGPMADLPRELAFDIYADKYWDSLCGDQLVQLSEAIAEEVVDTGVNMGVGRAAEFLQRSLNVFNVGGRLYDDLAVDGLAGPVTVAALRDYLAARSEAALLKALNCLQGAAYIELAERREKDERFVYGWIQQRVKPGHNADSIGVCLVGGMPDCNYTSAQWACLESLVNDLVSRYDADVIGHNDVSEKPCPMFDAKAWAQTLCR